MIEPYYQDDAVTLYHARAEEVLPQLAPQSIDLILTDPPYYRVKSEWWDRQWNTREGFLTWIRSLAGEWHRVLKPNGSLYVFAASHMAAWVEVTLSEVFHVLQRVTWRKPPFTTKAEMFRKEDLRCFFPASEAILFCEQYGADRSYDTAILGENGTYWQACESLKVSIFGSYLQEEFTRAAVSRREIAALFPSATGGMTGCVSNWILGYNCPTKEQYETIRAYLNNEQGSQKYLRKDYEDLRKDYEYLRKDYEDLRKDYEDLRRPFLLSPDKHYTDVWDFETVHAEQGKHPCEKPLPMLHHIIKTSSRPDDVILDCFAGRSSTLDASKRLGRRAIGIEIEEEWCRASARRLRQEVLPFGRGA